ncbi:MAG: hypothetical protein KKD99_02995 [Proteobacteria bacterium]|nr:hypothetical protein [Pseudomonadota bacterium]MBU4357444.1 hypothetical protein [Pseudomonadota bacterium]MBU4447529.1 hypothetical protein [Pseudomonadota bacterium]MCG2771937.1 hypothetical protein [Desulfobacterales bacterium]
MASNYIEISKHYNKQDFDNWRNAEWWENEEWINFLPKEEHHRVENKYRPQACSKYNKGMEGHQFTEVLEMIDLKKIGYKWLHANYYLFKDVKPTAPVYGLGADEIKKVVGKEKVEYLVNYVSNRSLKASEPDLFAYRINKINKNNYDMVFIEC